MNKHCSAWLASIAFGIVGRAASAQQSGCEVTMPTAFRLLARQAPASGGPEYPAQTRVRAITYGTGMQGGRRAVRVQIDTAEGWVYLWPNQLLRCPPDSIAQRPGDIDPNAQDRPNEAPPPPTTRPSTPACVPGSTQACLCVGGGSGVQSCTASGDAFESCSCVAPEPARTPPPDPGPPASGGALQIGGRTANFGVRRVSPGFVPDPINVVVTSGGNIDTSSIGIGAGCRGFVTRNPDQIIRLTGTSANLRLYVTAPGDTTLLINDAAGRWHCNDDSYGGTNPTLDIENAGPGQYDVWVGSYRAGEMIRGVLHITELAANHP